VCFSATADIVGGVVIGAIGIDALRNVAGRREYSLLAALPFVLAAHQLNETFVWWGLQGHVPTGVGRVATWAYLVVAFVVLPVYIPVAIAVVERNRRRRSVMLAFAMLGAAVAGILLAAMVRGPVTATLGSHYISYTTDLRAGGLVVSLYVIATCGSLVFSGSRQIARFGLVNLFVAAALAWLATDGFASLWCAWAAVSSAAFALHLRHPKLDLIPLSINTA
jgi:hypothetical protein